MKKDWKKDFNISMREVIRICKSRYGRLPKPGREFTIIDKPGYKLCLQNNAGKYQLYEYKSVNV